ncbi:MAG TPA: choice-of-anchor E domain-containing protein, partial [Isosphaeraceae bacterium]|nr:choice-of-anchor E domain-containing protein [Isosphaeraceae bacterium]
MTLLQRLSAPIRGAQARTFPRCRRNSPKARPGLETLENLALMDAGVSALAGPATVSEQAEQTVTYSDTLPLTQTNFSTLTDADLPALSIPQFNPSLGTLNSVELTFQGGIQDQIKVENLDPTTATIRPTLGGVVTLTLNGVTFPSMTITKPFDAFEAAAYDGQRNFSGPSGRTYPVTEDTRNESQTLNASSSDLSPFIGSGNFQANVAAVGQSVVAGPANMVVQTNTQATATLSVVYHYTPALPPAVGGEQVIQTPPPTQTPCPAATITGIARYGVHRQSVVLVASFDHALNPVQATNTANYRLLSSGPDFQFGTYDDQVVPIQRVVYNAATNRAELFVRGGANVHRLYNLSINTVAPCGTTASNSVLFDRSSLTGFVAHRTNALVPLTHPIPQMPFSAVGNNQYTLLSPRTQALLSRRQMIQERVNQVTLMRETMLNG